MMVQNLEISIVDALVEFLVEFLAENRSTETSSLP